MCHKKWIFDLALTVDVTSHLNDQYLELRGIVKLISRLVNDISAFKMKSKPFISQLKSKNFSQFPRLMEQSKCSDDLANFAYYTKKDILRQEASDFRFRDFAEEEDCTLAFINPFSRAEQNIPKMPCDNRRNLLI